MSTNALERRSFAPPTHHEAEIAELAHFLKTSRDNQELHRSYLQAPSGDRQEIPSEIFELLTYIVDALSEGKGVTVMPTHAQLTTQQAADHLGMSRPTLVKLLEQGEIPFTKVGRHRRVTLNDLIDYEERSQQARQDTLRELTKEATSAGTYFKRPDTSQTR